MSTSTNIGTRLNATFDTNDTRQTLRFDTRDGMSSFTLTAYETVKLIELLQEMGPALVSDIEHAQANINRWVQTGEVGYPLPGSEPTPENASINWPSEPIEGEIKTYPSGMTEQKLSNGYIRRCR